MSHRLLISVHLHDTRYHGLPDWPPAPARLFQALVAAAASGPLPPDHRIALEWLETLAPPIVAAPPATVGQGITAYVPNNDLDAVNGDVARVSEIRAGKRIKPRILDADASFMYAWDLKMPDEPHATTVCSIAKGLYQFGRGVDMAWARASIVTEGEWSRRLNDYHGAVYMPTPRDGSFTLACPAPGSLNGLCERHAAVAARFQSAGSPRRLVYLQPPPVQFKHVPYESKAWRETFEVQSLGAIARYAAKRAVTASPLVEQIRDQVVERLRTAIPALSRQVDRYIAGRVVEGSPAVEPSTRVRIIPLPSVGHEFADHHIRRILVEVPGACPLPPRDVQWAFSGLELRGNGSADAVLVPAVDARMARHFGVDAAPARRWRTVTAAALPEQAARRRIDPLRVREDAKGSFERAAEQARAIATVRQAIRHAGVRAAAHTIEVQREPFDSAGERAERFAVGTRFAKERLWHVQVSFDRAVSGPVVIGDGRFLGLGVMMPIAEERRAFAFVIDAGLADQAEPHVIARALRRAVMSRAQEIIGRRRTLPRFFTGHERDGTPSQASSHPHLAFAFDPDRDRLLVIVPESSRVLHVSNQVNVLEDALSALTVLRAGSAGRLSLRATHIDFDTDPLFRRSRAWTAVTQYQVTRHSKRTNAKDALAADIESECRRHRLPKPAVTVTDVRGVPGLGLVGSAHLEFKVAVSGPILLGRSRHFGGGLFTAEDGSG